MRARAGGVALAASLVVALLATAAAGQSDPMLMAAFTRFLKTQDIQFDVVPDLYEGGYARISVYAKNAMLGGIQVDEVWFKLVGITLDVGALQQGTLRILNYRGTAFSGRVSVQQLQEFFLTLNAFNDLRLWSDGTSLYGEGTVPYHGMAIKLWLMGRFSVNGGKEVHFHIDNMRVNGFPLFSPIIRILESQINPVISQKDWPVNFAMRSLQMTTEGFVISSQADAVAPCTVCPTVDGMAEDRR
jgi:hypothetical protein